MSPLSIGTLFSGIGGLELGLERAGLGPTVWQVEKDAYCRAVLAKHWPNATRYEDVKDVGRSNLAPVDVLCGGFPCQDISYAGKGAGLDGARSGLWYEYARIIRELGPRYAVVENVAALLDRGLGDVLGTLADIGYDAEWSGLSACAVGASHARERVFLVAYPRGDIGQRRAQERKQRRANVGVDDLQRCWSTEPPVGRVVDGVRARLARNPLRALGNSVVPQVAEVVGRVIQELESQRRVA